MPAFGFWVCTVICLSIEVPKAWTCALLLETGVSALLRAFVLSCKDISKGYQKFLDFCDIAVITATIMESTSRTLLIWTVRSASEWLRIISGCIRSFLAWTRLKISKMLKMILVSIRTLL